MRKNISFENIHNFQIGHTDATFNFEQRLARENGWALHFAERVTNEYRRFVYLVSLSNNEVTPSDEVDQAWHLHLTYTRSYWHDLCKNILGFELHHNPTQGGQSEQRKYKQQYVDTLAFYEQVFNETPPEDIWPSVDKRFASAQQFIRINKNDKWILNKPGMWLEKALMFLVAPFYLVACTEDFSEKGFIFWIAILVGAYLVYKLVAWITRNGGKNSGGGGGTGCGGCSSGCGGCGG